VFLFLSKLRAPLKMHFSRDSCVTDFCSCKIGIQYVLYITDFCSCKIGIQYVLYITDFCSCKIGIQHVLYISSVLESSCMPYTLGFGFLRRSTSSIHGVVRFSAIAPGIALAPASMQSSVRGFLALTRKSLFLEAPLRIYKLGV